MTPQEVMETRANARIHVERAIERLKNYKDYLANYPTVTQSYFFAYGVCKPLSSKFPGNYCQVTIIRQRYYM